MTITKAIERFYWNFKRGISNENRMILYQKDLDALEVVANYVNETQKRQYEANELFAKLYIFLFRQYLEKYRTTVFDKNVRKSIGEILEKSINHHVEELRTSLNESELYALLMDAGATMKHPAMKTEEDHKMDLKAVSRLNVDQLVKAAKNEIWDHETVQEAIISEVNNMINLHG